MLRDWRTIGRAQQAEHLLLILFLIGQVWHFVTQAGQVSGFDSGDFLFRVKLASEGDLNPDLHRCFWAYHPPLAFLLARCAQRIFSVNDVRGIQIVSQVSLLVAFFALRETLKCLRLLATVAGIGLLYLSFSLPLTIHAAVSLNMDVIVLAFASIILLCSVLLWKNVDTGKRGASRRFLVAFVLVLALTAALFTKFSGLLLGVLPVLVAINQSGNLHDRLKTARFAGACVLLAILLAMPYYYTRYYRATGSFFPNVNEWWYPEDLRAARGARDVNRIAFLGSLFEPSTAKPTLQENTRDLDHARLVDTWGDLWLKDPVLGTSAPITIRMGRIYRGAFAVGSLIGVLTLWLRYRRSRGGTWWRFGRILLIYGVIQIAALIFFIYQQPLATDIPGKCLYILPIAWTIAYLIATLLPQEEQDVSPGALVVLAAIGGFFLANLLLPVY
jgi:hypothetical protein